MPLNLTGRHFDISSEVQTYVRKRADRFHKYHNRVSLIEVVLSKEKRHMEADVLVKAGKDEFRSSEKSPDLRAAIDMACDKIERQMEKKKEKSIDRKRGDATRRAIEPPEDAATFAGPGELPTWIHPEEIEVKPYTLEEALERLNQIKHRSFFVFRHSQSDAVNVIFRRSDGLIGLIEP